jgi:DNA ligase-1
MAHCLDNGGVLLAEAVAASRDVAATSSRKAKVDRIATLLKAAGPKQSAVVVPWLSGELRQRRTGVGWATLKDAPPAATVASLTIAETDGVFETVSLLAGPGSASERRRLVHDMFGRATADEQGFLRGLISGELRQGALEGVMTDAIAQASGVPLSDVRRAVMLCGATAPVAAAALADGGDGLTGFRLQVGRPLQPMLASTAASVGEAVDKLGEASFEWKLDGIRVQLHKSASEVAVFSRSLDNITARVPELVEAAGRLPVDEVVLDGEAIAFFEATVARGHEGVVAKALTAPYEAGRRGGSWLKVKPVHTLDLVILAAEWGHGRRQGWLSNLHLGARDPESGQFVMLGKTFKGLTDEMLKWQTEKLLTLERSRNDWQVFVEPSLVVEIAFDGVQTSPRYPGGVALRFARVLRYREDKSADEADTIDTVRAFRH